MANFPIPGSSTQQTSCLELHVENLTKQARSQNPNKLSENILALTKIVKNEGNKKSPGKKLTHKKFKSTRKYPFSVTHKHFSSQENVESRVNDNFQSLLISENKNTT